VPTLQASRHGRTRTCYNPSMGASREESPLVGGRQSEGVVRVGNSARRVPGRNAEYVRALLTHLRVEGFGEAPRWLGVDGRGRDILTFIIGDVAHGDARRLSDAQLASSACLIRRFHDATAGSHLAQGHEVVAHTDLGPHNTVFRGDDAVGLIDWDGAEAGTRLVDFAHAVWCFAPVGEEGGPLELQGHRIRLLCDAYGWDDAAEVVEEIAQRLQRAAAQHAAAGRERAVRIFNERGAWLRSHRNEFAETLNG
jgi:hypothetical protein